MTERQNTHNVKHKTPFIRHVYFWISDSASPRWDFLSDRLHLDTLVAKIGCRFHGHAPFTDMDGITVYCSWNCGKVFDGKPTGGRPLRARPLRRRSP